MSVEFDSNEPWDGEQYEYQVFKEESIATSPKVLDMLQWFNDIGAKGWRIFDFNPSVQPSGMFTDQNEPIKKFVLEGMFVRRKRVSE